MFRYEVDLVAAAIEVLAAGLHSWGVLDVGLEFDYRCGRTDIVAVSADGAVIAIEAKLRDWREALHQAYRNTSFAAESYVLMPALAAQRAIAHSDEFDRRGVGLCVVSSKRLEVLHPARRQLNPVLQALNRRAADFASSSGGG
jgi:hypothetical protein